MSTNDYRNVIKTLFKVIRPATYVEVGCRNGETLRQIMPVAKELKTQVYAVDIRKSVESNLPKGVNFICGDSFEIGKKWNSKIDMIFIDADHRSKFVLRDFETYSQWVRRNGIILLHDTYPLDVDATLPQNCGDAWKVAWHIRKNLPEFEIITLPITNGISIVRNSSNQMDWQNEVPVSDWSI